MREGLLKVSSLKLNFIACDLPFGGQKSDASWLLSVLSDNDRAEGALFCADTHVLVHAVRKVYIAGYPVDSYVFRTS